MTAMTTFLLNLRMFLDCFVLLPVTAILTEASYIIWATYIDPRRDEKRKLEIKKHVKMIRQSIHDVHGELGRLMEEQERRAAKFIAGVRAGEEASVRTRKNFNGLLDMIKQTYVDYGVLPLVGKGDLDSKVAQADYY